MKRKTMTKTGAILVSAVLLGSTLAGCAGKAGTSGDVQGDPKPETQA